MSPLSKDPQDQELRALRAEVARLQLALVQVERQVGQTNELPGQVHKHELNLGIINTRLDCFFGTLQWIAKTVLVLLFILAGQQACFYFWAIRCW